MDRLCSDASRTHVLGMRGERLADCLAGRNDGGGEFGQATGIKLAVEAGHAQTADDPS